MVVFPDSLYRDKKTFYNQCLSLFRVIFTESPDLQNSTKLSLFSFAINFRINRSLSAAHGHVPVTDESSNCF